MQKQKKDPIKLLLSTEQEIFNKVIDNDHAFRKLNKIIDFDELVESLRELYSDLGQTGIDIEKGFKALLIQFWEDYSDREMEKALKENLAIKWFCDFGLTENTPHYSYFSKLRKRIGTENIADIFNEINNELRKHGLFGDVFKFIDASSIISKTQLWEERDKAIKNGEEKLNNKVVNQYTADKDAKWGAKSKNNIWFGYKRHNVLDMRYGLIDKSMITPANVLDFQVMEDICPRNCMIFADKLYDTKKTYEILVKKDCHSGIIQKNNNKEKNKDLDKWKSRIRMPFEGNFSKLSKKARFKGLIKMKFQGIFESICFNLKKATKIVAI
jgi:transposase, IS5 family